jgi:hypothetical protein
MLAERHALDADLIACSNPYLAGHLNCFGRGNHSTASGKSECPREEKGTPEAPSSQSDRPPSASVMTRV